MKSGLKIGVLAVQGAFIEHKRMLESLGCECVELRQKSDICDLDGLVLPGGCLLYTSIIEKLLKNPEIVCHKPIYAAIAGSDLLSGCLLYTSMWYTR